MDVRLIGPLTSTTTQRLGWRPSFIPTYEVPPVTADLPANHALATSEVFSLQYLADPGVAWNEKSVKLQEFIASYSEWVAEQGKLEASRGLECAAARVESRLNFAVERMARGLAYLDNNPGPQQCFILANQIMLMQMIHSGEAFGGTSKEANSFVFKRPDYFSRREEEVSLASVSAGIPVYSR